jgi:hypothetical protein
MQGKTEKSCSIVSVLELLFRESLELINRAEIYTP